MDTVPHRLRQGKVNDLHEGPKPASDFFLPVHRTSAPPQPWVDALATETRGSVG